MIKKAIPIRFFPTCDKEKPFPENTGKLYRELLILADIVDKYLISFIDLPARDGF